MTDDHTNKWQFRRGLDDNFMNQLQCLARQPGWLAEVLADPDLILGIRNNYMNVYWRGQSLFRIWRQGETGPLKFSTHPKYLFNPDLSKQVVFDGAAFGTEKLEPFIDKYEPKTTLQKMKRAARRHCGDEKKGVHAIAVGNEDIVDTEVAFNDREDEPHVPRIDLACFEEEKGRVRLCFWEAKLYSNREIRAEGEKEAPVVEQVRGYRDLVDKHREEVIESYRKIARNLVEIAGWVFPHRKVGKLVEAVAVRGRLDIDKPATVGLIVFGFDNDQKGGKVWRMHMEKLKVAVAPVQYAGDPKDIRPRARGPEATAVGV